MEIAGLAHEGVCKNSPQIIIRMSFILIIVLTPPVSKKIQRNKIMENNIEIKGETKLALLMFRAMTPANQDAFLALAKLALQYQEGGADLKAKAPEKRE